MPLQPDWWTSASPSTTEPPFGGFGVFEDSESLAVWSRRAGYATSLVGKYLNRYRKDDPTYIPPGRRLAPC